MRGREYFHSLRILPGLWPVIRVDGRSFSRLTETLEKPFDIRFHRTMVSTAMRLLEELGGLYAYTESDEISVLLPKEADLFDREVEKLVSVSAGIASTVFTYVSNLKEQIWAGGVEAGFDSRLWLGTDVSDVQDYFRWRLADAHRCALNSSCYWLLRKEGMSKGQATSELKEKDVAWKNEMLFKRGINFNELPIWQRRGTGLYWEAYEKDAQNPITGEKLIAKRRRIKVDEEIPAGDDYSVFVKERTVKLEV